MAWVIATNCCGGRLRQVVGNGKIMDETVQKSCWGVTAKAVLGIAALLLLAWLVGGAETATTAVIAAG